MNGFSMRLAGAALALGIGCSAGSTAPPVAKAEERPGTTAPAPLPTQLSVPPSASPHDFWLSKAAVQGAVLLGRAPQQAVSVAFDGAAVPLDAQGFFIIGFDRDAGTSATLTATLRNGAKIVRTVPVRQTAWNIERVNANPTGGAASTAEFKARRDGELAQISAARSTKVESNGWRQKFAWPIDYWLVKGGRLSGQFGAQRIYNGWPASYHNGMDIAAPTGTVFKAPADGVVVLAAQKPFTLEGHLLIIDHGQGLNSAFLHCSQLLVSAGQLVKQGQPIGKVGATGRASGPHLHWGMKWNAARVDPRQTVPAR
jgi:murein DD-endopeptidase MepM/ murein hydrolase activator NlpD